MLIKELQDLQRQHGYRPREALHDLTERLNVLFFEVYGVASFYPHLRFEPPTSTTICAGNVGQRAKGLAMKEKLWPRRTHANCSGRLG
jgi:NADH:ubiquinone oxidoreductase subunit E